MVAEIEMHFKQSYTELFTIQHDEPALTPPVADVCTAVIYAVDF